MRCSCVGRAARCEHRRRWCVQRRCARRSTPSPRAAPYGPRCLPLLPERSYRIGTHALAAIELRWGLLRPGRGRPLARTPRSEPCGTSHHGQILKLYNQIGLAHWRAPNSTARPRCEQNNDSRALGARWMPVCSLGNAPECLCPLAVRRMALRGCAQQAVSRAPGRLPPRCIARRNHCACLACCRRLLDCG